ncbi:prepilin-type N-terminal cleavage/methylation domain-containing protein (plasmid) [Rossellomorea sp. AcN35-11]|nr:type II secretion system GspH family protein [Rossellomorea aquimaris]WJV32314.1 prepilin-type N-terminal cleavage/methylation domain-containing protein [Rossellomorea sp. AcN35-11]
MNYLRLFNKRISNQNGLTLMELLAVLLVISVITAISISVITGQGEKSRVAAHQSNVKSIINVVELYDYDKGFIFDTTRDLGLLSNNHEIVVSGYIKEIPENPWEGTNEPYEDFQYYVGLDDRGVFHIVLAEDNGTSKPDPLNVVGIVNEESTIVHMDTVINPSFNVKWTLN